MTENKYYLVVNGTSYDISDGVEYGVLEADGLGLAPVTHMLESAPLQHGASHTGFKLKPRVVSLVLDLVANGNDSHFERREDMLLMALYRSTPLALKVVYGSSSNVRQIDGFVDGGLEYASKDMKGFSQIAAVRLLCPDPTFYDPTRQVFSIISDVGGTGFPVPTAFPTTFGSVELDMTEALDYYGTWREYPVIELYGPVNAPVIENLDTGETLSFPDLSLNSDTAYFIDCRYGYKTVYEYDVTDRDNPVFVANRINMLSSDSDLSTFHLTEREPGGTYKANNIRVSGDDASADTKLIIRYYTRYIGL